MCPVTEFSENHVIVMMCNINCGNIVLLSHNTYIPGQCLIIAAFE